MVEFDKLEIFVICNCSIDYRYVELETDISEFFQHVMHPIVKTDMFASRFIEHFLSIKNEHRQPPVVIKFCKYLVIRLVAILSSILEEGFVSTIDIKFQTINQITKGCYNIAHEHTDFFFKILAVPLTIHLIFKFVQSVEKHIKSSPMYRL